MKKKSKLLFTDSHWDSEIVDRIWKAADKLNKDKYQLDYHQPQFDIVSAEQMLDAYGSIGLPNMYNHWSFGKAFLQSEKDYLAGDTGLALEMVINTNPCIAYLMENNTALMQCMVILHANLGHASMFKTNYLFKAHTQSDSIIDYVGYAKRYMEQMEEKYGADVIEGLLDTLHCLKYFGIDKIPRQRAKSKEERSERNRRWVEYQAEQLDQLDRITDGTRFNVPNNPLDQDMVVLEDENILRFLEKKAPHTPDDLREVIRIVRTIAQYFYPQMQTKLLHEGWATFWHYQTMHDFYDLGYLDEGHMLEFYQHHASVVAQPKHSAPNVYALGFDMFKELKRVCENPTQEEIDDPKWSAYANQDWLAVFKDVAENFNDSSFIMQFLHPNTVEKFGLFELEDDPDLRFLQVKEVSDDIGFREIRKALAYSYDIANRMPNLKVTGFSRYNRVLELTYVMDSDNIELYEESIGYLLASVQEIWGHDVYLVVHNSEGKFVRRYNVGG